MPEVNLESLQQSTTKRFPIIRQSSVLTVSEVASFLAVSVSTIYSWTHNKRIPHYKPTGKNLFFIKEEIEDWILKGKILTEDEISVIENKRVYSSDKPRIRPKRLS